MAMFPAGYIDKDYLKVVRGHLVLSLGARIEQNFNPTDSTYITIPSGYKGISIAGWNTNPNYRLIALRWENDTYAGYVKNESSASVSNGDVYYYVLCVKE